MGIALAFVTGIPTLRLAKWSGRNDFLQACLAAEQAGFVKEQCNSTIEAGPVPPPFTKRESPGGVVRNFTIFRLVLWPEHTWQGLGSRLKVGVEPRTASLMVVLMLAIGIVSLLYIRPRAQPFRDDDSLVKPPLTVISLVPLGTDPYGDESGPRVIYQDDQSFDPDLDGIKYFDDGVTMWKKLQLVALNPMLKVRPRSNPFWFCQWMKTNIYPIVDPEDMQMIGINER